MNNNTQTIDSYINNFRPEIQILLNQMRLTIKQTIPEAQEEIKYGMPTFVFQGNVVHFAACKNHIGFYPTPSGINAFSKELSIYTCTKGSIHFPLDQPLPIDLIGKIATFRINEIRDKAQLKKTTKQK